MKRIIIIALSLLFLGGPQLMAQDGARTVLLNLSTNDSIIPGPGPGINIVDDGGMNGSYTGGTDYHLTILGDCSDSSQTVLCLEVQPGSYDLAPGDTLYFYDGASISSPLLAKFGHNYQSKAGASFYISSTNSTGMITIRFRSKMSSDPKPSGFKITVCCKKPCEYVHPVIDSVYEHVSTTTGQVITRRKMQAFPDVVDTIYDMDTIIVYDTAWRDSAHTAYDLYNPHDSIVEGDIIGLDTVSYIPGMTTCIGLGIRLHGHGEYTHNTGYYQPSDMTSKFIWVFENVDSLWGTGMTQVSEDQLQNTGCTKVYLTIIDEQGCRSTEQVMVQIRAAQNPIKTLFSLNPICNNSYYPVTVGVNDENSTLNLKRITFDETYSKTYTVRTFIPDGKCTPPPNTDVYREECFMAPVTFNEFPPGKKVERAGDICSICVNYEHSFMGDYRIAIVCPTWDKNNPLAGGMAVLKWGKRGSGGSSSTCDPDATEANSPDGTSAGSGTFTGVPLDGSGGSVNGHDDEGYKCDSLTNPFGIGFDYCWSRNGDYTLVTGHAADYPTFLQAGDWYISSTGAAANNTIRVSDADLTWRPMPSWMADAGAYPSLNGRTITTRKPSNHEDKTDYYSPASDFSDLIGCPLNGDWKIMVCDWWGADNGWVFNWSLDICGVSAGGGGCVYQVEIDSVTWRPDTNYATDYRDGVYRGLQITDMDSVTAHITSPDTSGTFPINLKIYDEFGCIWDTNTHITTIHQPLPNLGEDITLCSADSILLKGSDGHKGFNLKYLWEPYGQEDAEIYTKTDEYGNIRYIVEVRNSYINPNGGSITCRGRDTINVTINEQPILNFDPGVYPLEGCEPFTLKVKNTTKYGDKYRWEFGDGVIQTVKEPTHTYGAGQYTLKYYVESAKGCRDSLIFDSLVTVFPNPKAAFSWEPEFPTVTRPEVQLINNTTPIVDANKYFWEVQYSRDHPNSYSTLTEMNPTYRWKPKDGEDVTGDYTVRLISRTDNYGPSGRLVQCADTIESTILIINDNIHFPTVVTPNGDGINDRFVIQGLVEGLGYQINTLDIYDKWGSRVFHADNISQDDQFWDPAKTNSPTGTYFYRFIGRGQAGTMERNGVVELLR